MMQIQKRRMKHLYWLITQNISFQHAYQVSLGQDGHQVECFTSVTEIFNVLPYKLHPDFVLIDYYLPKNDREKLLKVLHSVVPLPRVIILQSRSGFWDEELEEVAPITLRYPTSPEELIKLSDRLITQSQNFFALFYRDNKQFCEKIITILDNLLLTDKCVLLVSNPQEISDWFKNTKRNLRRVDICAVSNYLHEGIPFSELLALYVKYFIENQKKEFYTGICVIIDLSLIMPRIDEKSFEIYIKWINLILKELSGYYCLICAYPSNLSAEFQEVIRETYDQIL